ncbi:hypothetical protein B484DRAFT_410853, partial [Ochromonadaceae sp. CCMP2298]
DSLSGNTRTILIACVAPTELHATESLSTLQFADRAKSVMLSVKPNTVVDDKLLLSKAYAEITRLKALLAQALKQLERKEDRADRGDRGAMRQAHEQELEQLQTTQAQMQARMQGQLPQLSSSLPSSGHLLTPLPAVLGVASKKVDVGRFSLDNDGKKKKSKHVKLVPPLFDILDQQSQSSKKGQAKAFKYVLTQTHTHVTLVSNTTRSSC